MDQFKQELLLERLSKAVDYTQSHKEGLNVKATKALTDLLIDCYSTISSIDPNHENWFDQLPTEEGMEEEEGGGI